LYIYSETFRYKVTEIYCDILVLFMLLALVISLREKEKWTLYLPVNKKVIHQDSATENY